MSSICSRTMLAQLPAGLPRTRTGPSASSLSSTSCRICWRTVWPQTKLLRSRRALTSARARKNPASRKNCGTSCSRGTCAMISACNRVARHQACPITSRPLKTPRRMETRRQRRAGAACFFSQRTSSDCRVLSMQVREPGRARPETGWRGEGESICPHGDRESCFYHSL